MLLSEMFFGHSAAQAPVLVQLPKPSAGATGTLHLTLGKEGKLAHLGADKQHCRAIFAGCHAGAATDAGSRVHSLVGDLLRDRQIVGIGSTAAVEAYIAAGLLDLVEGVAVHHQVAHYGEGCRAPGLDSDLLLVVEFAHVELAGGDTLHRAVGMAVDIQRAHAADTLAAVVVEHYRLLTLVYQLLIEHVKHLQERAAGRHVFYAIFDELARLFRTTLTPNLQVYIDCRFHMLFRVIWWEPAAALRSEAAEGRLLRGCFYDL